MDATHSFHYSYLMVLVLSVAAAFLVVVISLAIALFAACYLIGRLARIMTEAQDRVMFVQEHVMSSSAQAMSEAMSTAARSIVAPYSISAQAVAGDGDGGIAPTPAAGAAWIQDDEIPVGSDWDPTDVELPDPAFFRPDARVQGVGDHWTGVDGLKLGAD